MKKELNYFDSWSSQTKWMTADPWSQKYQLNSKTVLWRYMSTEQFLSMLSTKSLYFARLDTLDDPFEGYPAHLYDESYRDAAQLNRNWIFINCWHKNKNESEYMWKHHGIENSVAIKTKYDCFIKSIDNETTKKPRVQIGPVKYIDHRQEANVSVGDNEKKARQLFPYLYKQKQFELEQEVRAVCSLSLASHNLSLTEFYEALKRYPKGFYFPVCLDSLIEEIVVAPTSGKWYYDLIEDAICRYRLRTCNLKESSIEAHPQWNHDTYVDIFFDKMKEFIERQNLTEDISYYEPDIDSETQRYTISPSGKISSETT